MADRRQEANSGAVRTVRIGGFALVAGLLLFVAGLVSIVVTRKGLPAATIGPLIFAIGIWSTGVYLRAFGYRRATIPGLFVIIGLAVYVAAGNWLLAVDPAALVTVGRNWNAKRLFTTVPLATAYAALIMFAVHEFRFRRHGGGIWVSVGVLHMLLAGSVLCRELATVLFGVWPTARTDVAVVALIWLPWAAHSLVYPAALICHAIGLFKAVGKIREMDDVATVFD